MKFSIFKVLCLSLFLVMPVHLIYAQTASILPPAKTTFLDNNGKPLVGGKIDFYVPGTTTRKLTWQDAGQTIPNNNPVTLDSAGRALILGDGSYRQIVKDKYGNLIWDQVTSSTGSGGGGTTPTVGDGDAVGTVKAWSGFVAPYGYVFAYGQEFVRTSRPEAFAVLTSQQNVSCSSGSPTLTGVGATTQLPIGAPIESSCLNAGATIVSKTISTVTASSNAVISTTTTARFFPFGNGDGSATFNIPDLRGRVIAGNDIMGGIAANRLTSTYYGVSAAALGANGGNQSQTLTENQLPALTKTLSLSASATTDAQKSGSNTNVNNSPAVSLAPNSATLATGTVNVSVSGTVTFGGGNPHSIVQPTTTYNYIIKVIPDSNPNSFFGVASLGGMTGVITCGFGITCAGNNISAISSVVPAPTPTTLGGVFQSSAPSLNFAFGVDGLGNILYAQPTFSNLAGTILPSQIANNTITNAMLNTGPALSIVGNNTNATANRTDIAAAADGNILRRSGTAIGFGSIDLSNSNSVGSSLLALANGGCNAALTASNGGVLWSNATQCQILAGTANAGRPLISGSSTSPSWAAYSLPGSVTSGGIAYFSSTSAMQSTALLAANQLMIGGGAGTAPATLGSLGTTTTVLHGNAGGVPSFGAVSLTADVTGVLPAANIPTATAAAKGIVQGDGSTLTITAGTISCTTGNSSQLGCLKPDGTTITSTGGTLTAVGAAATSIGVGTTTIAAGTNGYALYNNSGVLGNAPFQFNSQTFTSSGTFTTPVNSTIATVYHYRIVGGGGGGGGSNGSGAAAGGGGSGAYAEGTFTGVAASTGITITVGSIGSGGSSGANGTAGGNSIIGSPVSITAGGGNPGVGTSSSVSLGGTGGAVTGTPTIVSLVGEGGYSGIVGSSSASLIGGGDGGKTPLGYGGKGGRNNVASSGSSSVGYGSGGGGAFSVTSTGGNGAPGIVIIDWVL